MKRTTILLLLVSMLYGCAEMQARSAAKAAEKARTQRLAAQMTAYSSCKSFGFIPNTDSFSYCIERQLQQQRIDKCLSDQKDQEQWEALGSVFAGFGGSEAAANDRLDKQYRREYRPNCHLL